MMGCCAVRCVSGAPRYAFGEQRSPAVPLFSARARVADVDGEVEALMHEPGLLLGRVGNLCEACTAAGWRGGRRRQSWPCRPQEREASERPACRRLKMGRGLVSRPTRSALITFAAVASAMRLWQHGGGLSPCSAGELYPRVRCPLLTTSTGAGTRNWNGISFVSWAVYRAYTYDPDARLRCMGLCWQWVLAFGSETPQTPRTRPALRHIRDGSSVCSR